MQDETHSDHSFIVMLSNYISHDSGATMREINGN